MQVGMQIPNMHIINIQNTKDKWNVQYIQYIKHCKVCNWLNYANSKVKIEYHKTSNRWLYLKTALNSSFATTVYIQTSLAIQVSVVRHWGCDHVTNMILVLSVLLQMPQNTRTNSANQNINCVSGLRDSWLSKC